MPALSGGGASALRRALRACFAGFAGRVAIAHGERRPWASAGVVGVWHAIAIELDGPGAGVAADSFAAAVPERDFALAGAIIADVTATVEARESEERVRLRVEALTVAAD